MLSEIDFPDVSFRTCDDVRPLIRQACKAETELATHVTLGTSEEGRAIDAVVLGMGTKAVSLIAGAHADEPVGPETLRTFILQTPRYGQTFRDLFTNFKFIVIPQINPDGEARNYQWMKEWPSFEGYLQHAFREPPSRDLEFGFPAMRKENRLVAEFLMGHAPFDLHMSLHGMGFSDGGMLLIEKHWIERTHTLRERYATALTEAGIPLHDHDRKGEKGFQYIEPGFTTTPEGQAMQAYFISIGDINTARLFHDSSMEFVRGIGNNPLCLVTELPLFLIKKEVPDRPPGVPVAYLAFKEKQTALRERQAAGETIEETLQEFQLEALNLNLLVRLQFTAIQLGLEMVADE